MPNVAKTVFLSYRRDQTAWAVLLQKDLTGHGFDVFLDLSSIASGAFETVILENIRSHTHFLVLLTPSALERCDEPGDWFRREIEFAMAERRNIVPVMLDQFDFGAAGTIERLTGPLESLKEYNGLRIYTDYFDAGMERLRGEFLNTTLDVVAHPASVEARLAAAKEQAVVAAAPTVGPEVLEAMALFERAFQASQGDDQVRLYSSAIALMPGFSRAYINRGFVLMQLGKNRQAAEDFTTAITLEPGDSFAYDNRGIAFSQLKQWQEAVGDHSKAIELRPGDATAYTHRGNALLNLNRAQEAIEDHSKAIELRPDYASAYNNRGIAYLRLDKAEQALEDFTAAIRFRPGHAGAYSHRAGVLAGLGKTEGAMLDHDKAIELQPDYADAYYNRGNAFVLIGNSREAIRDYTRAINRKPDYAEAYYNRSVARRSLGQTSDAASDYESFLEYGGVAREGGRSTVRGHLNPPTVDERHD